MFQESTAFNTTFSAMKLVREKPCGATKTLQLMNIQNQAHDQQ